MVRRSACRHWRQCSTPAHSNGSSCGECVALDECPPGRADTGRPCATPGAWRPSSATCSPSCHMGLKTFQAHEVPAVAMMLLPAVLVAGALGAQEVVDLPEEDRFLVLDLDEVYRVGGSDPLLSRVRKAEFGGDGTLYLLDGNSASSARLLAIRDDGQNRRPTRGAWRRPRRVQRTASLCCSGGSARCRIRLATKCLPGLFLRRRTGAHGRGGR